MASTLVAIMNIPMDVFFYFPHPNQYSGSYGMNRFGLQKTIMCHSCIMHVSIAIKQV